MTAPTSRMTPEPADPNDLRTALTKLASDWEADAHAPKHWYVRELRALLAAHPAPETDEARVERAVQRWAHEMGMLPDEIDGTHYQAMAAALSEVAVPAPVSDTRREDAVREIERAIRQSFESDDHAHTYRRAALAVLAVLPAPPVVDEGIAAVLRAGTEIQAQTEAEVRERIAQDIEASILPNDDSPAADWFRTRAADIARGATR